MRRLWKSWIATSPTTTGKSNRAPLAARRRARLSVEALEGRYAPSGLPPVGVADAYSVHHADTLVVNAPCWPTTPTPRMTL
jgi:hypothetical protein